MTADCQAVLINGTVGSGKTTVAEALAERLESERIPGAVIDLDWLRLAWPQPPGEQTAARIWMGLSQNWQ